MEAINKIKVLQINADNFGIGGMSVTIWRLMSNLNDDRFAISYLTQREHINQYYSQNIEKSGGKIHKVNISPNKLLRYADRYIQTCKVLEENNYDIIHINGDEAFGIFPFVLAASKSNVKKIVIHAHTTHFKGTNIIILFIEKLLHCFMRPFICNRSDEWFACSREAAQFMYGKKRCQNEKLTIIKNGLNINAYTFNAKKREEIRTEHGAKEKFIVGHIGRFTYVKNHKFIIDTFKELVLMKENTELWLIGDGELQQQIRDLVKQYKLEKKVVFWGNTDRVCDYLSAMDVLIFPSKYEGMPLVLIEAQVSGIPVVCSDIITNEAIFSNNVYKMPSSMSPKEWADKLVFASRQGRNPFNCNLAKTSGFDIVQVAALIKQKYVNKNGR